MDSITVSPVSCCCAKAIERVGVRMQKLLSNLPLKCGKVVERVGFRMQKLLSNLPPPLPNKKIKYLH